MNDRRRALLCLCLCLGSCGSPEIRSTNPADGAASVPTALVDAGPGAPFAGLPPAPLPVATDGGLGDLAIGPGPTPLPPDFTKADVGGYKLGPPLTAAT